MKFGTVKLGMTAMFALAAMAATTPSLAQDVAAGEKVFAKCRTCHQIGPTAKNSVGPKLNGLIGRKTGQIEGYNYSEANKNSGLTWDEATFKEYIVDPQAKIKGTKMIFPGLKNPQDVNDIYAFLVQYDNEGQKKP